MKYLINLSAEAIEGSALSLKSVNDVHSSDSLSAGMLSVSDGISDDVLQETGQDVSDFLVDVEGDSLDSTSSGKSSDGRLGDAFDQRSRRLLGAALNADFADSLSSFSTFSDSSHYVNTQGCGPLIPGRRLSTNILLFIGRIP